MRKRFTRFIAALALLTMIILPMRAWAEDSPDYTYTLSSGDFSSTTHSHTSGAYTWTHEHGAGDNSFGWDGTYGFKFGSGNKSYPTSFTLTSSSVSSNIKKVVVTASVNSGKSCKLDVKVGSTTYGSQMTINTKNNDTWEFSIADASTVNGAVELSFSSNTGPLYLNKIEIYYYSGGGSTPSISVNPTSKNVTCAAGSAEFTITPSNIASPSYSLQFYSAATGSTTVEKPSWINTPSFDGNTLTLTYGANTDDERYAYFTVKSGEVESEQRVTLTQAEYTVTPPTITAAATSFDANMDVTITPASGTTVYYTTNGDTPSSSTGTGYTEAHTINIKATTTVKAIAYDANSVASTVTSATYTRQTVNISTITSTSSYSVVGTVVATHSKGIVIGDGTGYVYSYISGGHSLAVNNIVKFDNKSVTTYAHVFEFQTAPSSATISNYTSGAEPTSLNASGISGYMSGNHLSDYVQIEGTASVANGNYDVNVENATYNVRLAYPTTTQQSALNALNGKKVRVKGYFTGFNNKTDASATHFTIMLESVEDINPEVTASVEELTGFTYNYSDGGPSAAQSFTVSGSHLTADLVVEASSNYEVCLEEDGTYTSSVSVTPTSGTVSTTTVYSRLKGGLNSAAYASADDKITVSSTGATSKTIALSGTVTHAITKGTPAPSNGTLTVASSAYNGETVTITAEPASGYKLGTWSITKTDGGTSAGVTPTISIGNDYTITMPNFAITVNATFVPAYDITVTNSTPLGGSVTTTPTSAGEGETIVITVSPNSGYVLNSLVVKDAGENTITVTNNQFEMPGSNVTITVSFIAIYTVTYNANTDSGLSGDVPVDDNSPYTSGSTVTVLGKGTLAKTGYDFVYWSDMADGTDDNANLYEEGNEFDITENTVLYAQWSIKSYSYTLDITGDDDDAMAALEVDDVEIGINDKIKYGKEVTINVVVTDGYIYSISIKDANNNDVTVANNKFTMPASSVTVTVTSEVNPYAYATLTNSNMQSMSNPGTNYGTIKTITLNGFTWETNGRQECPSQSTTPYGMIQLRKRNNGTSDDPSYIQLPVFSGKIEAVTLSVTAASATTSSGTPCKATLCFQATNTASEDVITSGGDATNGTNEITLDLTSVVYATGYITVGNGSYAARIWNITVKYRPYQDMSGTTLPATLDEDVTISIPSSTNATATNLTIPESTGLIIKSGASLTVSGTLTNDGNANNLVIEDGGQLITNNSVKATVKKTITGHGAKATYDGWTFIASPVVVEGGVNPAVVSGMINATATKYDLYRFNDGVDKEWENYKNTEDHPNFTLVNGKGYLYANEDGTSLDFAGDVNPSTPDINVSLQYTEGQRFAGWNLVGNPFTADAYITNMSYYRMENDGEGNVVINPSSSFSGAIKPCEGVMVKANEGGENVTFTTTEPEGSANNGNINIALAQIQATRGEKSLQTLDNAIVSFNEGSELPKFYFGTQNANIYIPMDNEEYAIVSAEACGEMPVNFKAVQDGQYTITVNSEDVEMGYLHLIDNIAGKDIDLLATPSYTFNAKGDDYESRFRLVFSANMTNAEMGEDFAFMSDGQLVIANVGEAILQVIDVTGRVVANENINGTCSKAISAKAGVYVLRLINGTDVKTQKIVIR